MIGPGTRDPRRRRDRHPRHRPGLRLRAAAHGLRDRPGQRLPHQPGGHARVPADAQDPAAPAAVRLGRPGRSAASSAPPSSSGSPAAATDGSAAGSPPTGGTATASAGSGRRSSSRSCSRRCSWSWCCRRPAGRFAPGFGGLVAGITLAAIHLATIPVDNTGVNPARSLATAIFADTDPSALGQLWVFIVFPLLGSLIGVFVWLLLDDGRARGHDARHRHPARRPRQIDDVDRLTRTARASREPGQSRARGSHGAPTARPTAELWAVQGGKVCVPS